MHVYRLINEASGHTICQERILHPFPGKFSAYFYRRKKCSSTKGNWVTSVPITKEQPWSGLYPVACDDVRRSHDYK